jgi:glycosyltransferase involved in cell wall biosynthesis
VSSRRCYAIDARLNAYRAGGIAGYTRSLATAMREQTAADESLLLLEHRRATRPLIAGVARRRLWTPPHHRLEAFSLPVELAPAGASVLHFPDFIAPRLRPAPAVITIHDLAFLHFPEILDDNARRYYGQVRRAAHDADAIITVSQATRRDIVELLQIDDRRIDVIAEAADALFRPLGLAEGSRLTVGTVELQAGSYLLAVGTIEPRKNLTTLLQALQICRQRRPQTPYRLVLAGARGWLDEPIFAEITDRGLSDAVIHLAQLTQQDLLQLYNGCRLYANPSRYEGFGLPVLEALACAAPTLISAVSSLPEVAGDAAAALPPHDAAAWADTIERLWHDDGARAALAERGPARAAQFSWQRAAAETLAVYRRIVR